MAKEQFKTEKKKLDRKRDVKYRAYYFSLDIIDLLEILPRNYVFEIIGKQVLRSATSIGANIIEAQAGRTKKDFANFYQIALKSSNETKYWLAIIKEKCKEKRAEDITKKLLSEAVEIGNMLGASLLTLKGRRK